ncbi:CopD family protein [Aureimonas sp. AU40]|uniref:CopD family protein n=1 Tax=Aureimonas sp. AU40 TaxID=1637747 RepID=UPI0007828FAF|nr:CopD family protein [Aureimonas sp. AU40]
MGETSLSRLRAALRCLLLIGLMVAGALSLATPAEAHAGLVATEPADGAVLARAPDRFELTFSEPVSPLRLALIGPDGKAHALSASAVSGNRVEIAAPGSLGEGTHILTWRVVSLDGHPVAGSMRLSIGAPSAEPPAILAEFDRAVQALVWASRWLLYLGLFFGIGGAAGVFLGASPSGQALGRVRIALTLGLIAVPLSLGAQGLDALGAPLSALATGASWRAAMETGFGSAAGIAALALSVALLATWLPRRFAAPLAGLALLGAGLALASTGHASNAPPREWTRPAVALHTVTVALWIGALLPLAMALRAPQDADRTEALRRFSRRIVPVVALLLLSGGFLAVVQIGTLPALWQSWYGRVLLVKLALVFALLALAADNRWRLTRPALAGDVPSRRAIRRHIRVEIAVAVLILGTVALWRFTPPPRIEAAIAAEPKQAHATGALLMADLTLAPARAGPIEAAAMLMTIDYGPVNPQSVTFLFSRPGEAGEPIRQTAHNSGDGMWRAEATLPGPGLWHVRIDVAIDAATLDRLETDLYVRP